MCATRKLVLFHADNEGRRSFRCQLATLARGVGVERWSSGIDSNRSDQGFAPWVSRAVGHFSISPSMIACIVGRCSESSTTRSNTMKKTQPTR